MPIHLYIYSNIQYIAYSKQNSKNIEIWCFIFKQDLEKWIHVDTAVHLLLKYDLKVLLFTRRPYMILNLTYLSFYFLVKHFELPLSVK